jgi:hypothetical protein
VLAISLMLEALARRAESLITQVVRAANHACAEPRLSPGYRSYHLLLRFEAGPHRGIERVPAFVGVFPRRVTMTWKGVSLAQERREVCHI